jgi:plasmid stabilization system protein ParE
MYTVRWKQSALDRLAELWLDAADRDAVNAAVLEIDRSLASNPNEAGESRSENVRVIFCQPIGCFFFIDESRDVVEVLRVWTF